MNSSRPLGDAPERSYVRKLEQFAMFAEPELKRIFADLALPADRSLDLGCGVGLTARWLRHELLGDAYVVGLDLSLPHLMAAAAHHSPLVQADGGRPCFRAGAFDFIWACNTINHLADPVATLRGLHGLLRGGGRLALAQSRNLLPDMFFAWDAPLEDAVRAACHRAYRDKYGLALGDTAGIRGLVRFVRSDRLTNCHRALSRCRRVR